MDDWLPVTTAHNNRSLSSPGTFPSFAAGWTWRNGQAHPPQA